MSARPFLETIKSLFSFTISEKILDEVNRGILGKMAAKKIKYIVPNKLEIDDFEVMDDQGRRVLYGKRVLATISLVSLLTNNIRITDAFVDSPFFRYTIENGVHNIIRMFETPPTIPEKPPSSEKEARLRVTIEKVSVKNGNYEMWHDAGVLISAEGIVANGTFWVEPGPFGVDIDKVTIEKGMITTGGMDLPITNLVAKNLWISDEKVSTDDLVANYEKANITGQGTVFIDEDHYDIKATLNAPKGTYPAGLMALPFVAPAFRARVSMAGELTEPEIWADVNHDDTDFNGLLIKKGHVLAQISPHQILVEKATISVGERGLVTGHGAVSLDRKDFTFWTKEREILAGELGQFLSFDQPTKGVINAEAKLSGQFANDDENIRTAAKGTIEDGALQDIRLLDATRFDVDIDYVLKKSLRFHRAKVSDASGLNLSAKGQASLLHNSIGLSYELFAPQAETYIDLPNQDDSVLGIRSRGEVKYANEKLRVHGKATAAQLSFAKVTATNVDTAFDYYDDRLNLAEITASLHGGTVNGRLMVSELSTRQLINGEATARDVNLSPLSRPFTTLPLAGNWSASFEVDGSVSAPEVNFVTEIENTTVDKIDLGLLQFSGHVSKSKLVVPTFSVLTKSGNLDGENFSLDFTNKKMTGLVLVSDLNLAGAFSRYFGRLDGDLDGVVTIDGTYVEPVISAQLSGKKLSAFGIKMGSGPMTIALEKRPLLGRVPVTDLVFSLSANLAEHQSTNMIRFAFALTHETINTDIKFEELELSTTDLPFSNNVIGIRGRISGEITAEGKLAAPEFHAQLVAKEYGIFDPKHRDGPNSIKFMQGPAVLYAYSKNGKLTADLCANLSEATGGVVCQDGGFNLNVAGPYSVNGFSLALNGKVDHAHVENLLPFLRRELVTLDAAVLLHGKFTKAKNQPAQFAADLQFERMQASMPNIPTIKLQKPTTVSLFDDSFEIAGDAKLDFSPGQVFLRGSYARSALDIHFSGEIPLMVARFVVPIIQRADGLAKGDITLSGSLDSPLLEGKIVPEPKSLITFKKWLEAMEIREGAISFRKTSPTSFITKFDNFKLGLGDGRLFLNGIFDKHYTQPDEEAKSKFDLELTGSNIVLRDKLDYVEADFAIQTKHAPDSGAIAKGEITITDGSAHRQFDLRNFVAQAQGGIKPAIFKFATALDMRMDLDIAVRQFRASARMLNIDIETLLRGQLVAQGPVSHPKFKGSIVVTEGAIVFPATSFDLVESQIVLEENSDRVFDPKIDITATQDLPQSEFPQLTNDTVVEFSLRGDLDRLSLGLRPIRGDMRLSQLRIFLLLLSPQGGKFDNVDQGDILRRGAQNAAMAFSGEVFLRPLANELQELLEGRTKTRIQFGTSLDAGGLSLRFTWKLGPRIELQGSYAFYNERGDQTEKANYLVDSQYSLADLKLKLLLFDHRPLGPLSLETLFGSVRQLDKNEPRGKIRLKYRVLTQ